MDQVVAALVASDVDQQLKALDEFHKVSKKQNKPYCDDISRNVILPRLVELLRNHEHKVVKLKVAWALSNIVSSSTNGTQNLLDIQQSLPVLALLIHRSNHEVLSNACWSLNIISSDIANIQKVIDAGVCARLVELLG